MYFELSGFLRSVLAYGFDLVFLLLLTEWRVPRRRAFFLAGCFFAAVSAVNLAMRVFLPWGDLPETVFVTVSALGDVLFAWLISRYRDGRLAFSALSALLFSMVAGVVSYTVLWFSGADLWQILANLLLRPLLCLYLFRLRGGLLRLMADVPKGWGLLSLIPGICYTLYISLTLLPGSLAERRSNVPGVLLLGAAVFIIYSAFCSIFEKLRAQHLVEQEHTVIALQVEALAQRVEAFSEAEEEMKKFHHDLRHFVRIVSACIRNGDYGEAQRLLSRMDEDSGKILSEKLSPVYCNDPAINAVLSYYCERAEKSGVAIQAALELPRGLKTDTAELSLVLANALENAVLACERMPEAAEKRISLSGSPAGGQFLISICNTFPGEVEFDPKTGLPVSHRENHDIGGQSILAFAKRNNAHIDFSAEDSVFRLRILL